MPEPEHPVPSKTATVFLRNFATHWVRASLALCALFAAIFFFLWKRHCPGGVCDATFPLIRDIFVRMLWVGAAISALGGWGIYRAYRRMK